MKLTINGHFTEYISDYPHGWTFISNDPFKFPVVIENEHCFIKRFQTKSPGDISGWQLLQKLKERPKPNLPKVFDMQEVVEKDDAVAYVFYEYLEGNTLEQMLGDPSSINLRRLLYDIFKALEAIHNHGFWFADFCEKNIFCEKSGRYVLIDLDSAQPSTAVPANDMYGSKDYWIPVYRFYKKILDQPGIRLEDINGMGLDYLQFIFLILHLKLFTDSKRQKYRSGEDYDLLPAYLNNLDGRFQTLFIHTIRSGSILLPDEIIIETRKLIEDKIINNNTMNPNAGASKGAIIHEFRSNLNIVKNGEPFVLTWNADADKIDLYRNKTFFQTLGASQQSIERTEFHDSDKDVTYELVAYKDGVQSKSKPVIIKCAAATQSFDPRIADHLLAMVPWATFIAIVGIIACTLSMVGGISIAISKQNQFDVFMLSVVVSLLALILLLPMIFLLRFAIKMKRGLATNDNHILVESFKNMRSYFVCISITVIFILIGLIVIWASAK